MSETTEAPPSFAKSQVELAEILGSDRNTIRRWLKNEEDCPRTSSDGRYPIAAWKEWVQKKGKKPRKGSRSDKTALECEKISLENEKRKLALKRERGEVASREEVSRVMTAMAKAFAEELKKLKHTASADLVGLETPEISRRLGELSRGALEHLALGDWAQKKTFWSKMYVEQSDLLKTLLPGDGRKST